VTVPAEGVVDHCQSVLGREELPRQPSLNKL